MNKENIIIKIKKSELNASAEESVFLSINNSYLANCIIEESDDTISFEFDTKELFSCDNICKNVGEKFRLLFNCSDLSLLSEEIFFSMDPQNIMCDLNLLPKVLLRDKCSKDKSKDFLLAYKSFSAAILHPKYTYDNYFNGGRDLFQKNNELREIYECNDVDELKKYFLKKCNDYYEEETRTKVSVSRNKFTLIKIVMPIIILTFLLVSAFSLFAYMYTIPAKDAYLLADSEYFKGNYINVQDILSDFEAEDIPFSQRYILARAYVSSESMSQMQKSNVLEGLTVNTDESVINYWIYVGRLQFDNAVDLAKKMGDEELLLYAYIKQRAVVENDNILSGEEKSATLEELEEKITTIINEVTDSDNDSHNIVSNTVSSTVGSINTTSNISMSSSNIRSAGSGKGESDVNTAMSQVSISSQTTTSISK